MPTEQSQLTPRLQPLSQEQIEKPWKYIGYGGFSAFLASDDDFLIFRRFSTVNARVLLFLQDRISVLESELHEVDLKHSRESAVDIHNGSFRQENEPRRPALLLEIHQLLKDYSKQRPWQGIAPFHSTDIDEFLIQHSDLRSRAPALKKDVRSLENWFHNTQDAILDEEAAYVTPIRPHSAESENSNPASTATGEIYPLPGMEVVEKGTSKLPKCDLSISRYPPLHIRRTYGYVYWCSHHITRNGYADSSTVGISYYPRHNGPHQCHYRVHHRFPSTDRIHHCCLTFRELGRYRRVSITVNFYYRGNSL